MLKACLIAPAVALLLAGAAAAQPMPLPPSVADTPPAAAKPGSKAKAAKQQGKTRASTASRSGTRPERSSQSTAAPLRPFDPRDIADPQSDRRIQPQLTPSGGIGMGGRF
jgi:hypothetical protein